MRTITPRDGERHELAIAANTEETVIEDGTGAYEVHVTLGENAVLRYYCLTRGATATRTATLGQDAQLTWVEAATDGAHSTVTTTLGQGANAEYKSVMLGKDAEDTSVRSTMRHDGDRSTSNMFTRAVLLDRSTGAYEGLIRIHHAARGCDAYQKEETLLLSPDARMHATPNLEISNEDVRCSHGVSLGQVDEEQLFYFQARGIPRRQAIRLIVQGFFDEILASMGEHASEARARIATHLEALA